MIVHAIRCDQKDCRVESKLVETRTRALNCEVTYQKPPHWLEYDKKDFCSHACVSAYAAQQQREWDVLHRDPYECQIS